MKRLLAYSDGSISGYETRKGKQLNTVQQPFTSIMLYININKIFSDLSTDCLSLDYSVLNVFNPDYDCTAHHIFCVIIFL